MSRGWLETIAVGIISSSPVRQRYRVLGEAVIGFRDQQHDPAAAGAVAHQPIHAEAFGDRTESGLQRRQIDGEIGGIKHHPHEEMTGLDVVELLGVRMFCPLWARNVDTAETMPGRSGQDNVRTN